MKKLIIILGAVMLFPLTTQAFINDEGCLCSCVCLEEEQAEININTNQSLESLDYSDTIIISEIFPNPEGDDSEAEYIELYNNGEIEVDLLGWLVSDSAKKFKISKKDYSSTKISVDGYFVVYREISGISLNNTGEETVSIFQPDEKILDAVVYNGSQENFSLSLLEDQNFYWVVPSPKAKNNQPEEIEEESEEESEDEVVEEEADIQELNYSEKIIISEIFPNPEGADGEGEFIELYNSGEEIVDLTDWALSDATTRKYKLALSIDPQEYLVINRVDSGISLNNSDDKVELYQPDSNLLSEIEYTDCQEAYSYAEDSGDYTWTSVSTPGEANIILASNPEEDPIETNTNINQDIIGISQSQLTLPPNNSSRQVLYALLAIAAAGVVSLGVAGARFYKKKYYKKSQA